MVLNKAKVTGHNTNIHIYLRIYRHPCYLQRLVTLNAQQFMLWLDT